METNPANLPVPYPDSYWVLPGQLLAGEYPGHQWNDEILRAKLGALLDAGIRVFIDLTSAGELTAYEPALRSLASRLGIGVEWERHSIRDYSVPDAAKMTAILDRIDRALAAGQPVYVHCYGGIGRTGTVVACYLIRHGLDPEEALERLNLLRRAVPDAWRESPESDEQFAFVRAWDEGYEHDEDDW